MTKGGSVSSNIQTDVYLATGKCWGREEKVDDDEAIRLRRQCSSAGFEKRANK